MVETASRPNTEVAPSSHRAPDIVGTSKRPLEPTERLSEILFGLIMVLTFTSSITITGSHEINTLLIAAVGCNIAWGIVDAFMYLLAGFVERGRGIAALRAARHASHPDAAYRIIADAIPPVFASAMSQLTFEQIRTELSRLPEPPMHPSLTKEHWVGALAVFLAVFLSTFPPVIPFLIMTNSAHALRISNGIAVLLLFVTGYAFGRHAGYRPWRMGVGMALVGSVLVAITIELGG